MASNRQSKRTPRRAPTGKRGNHSKSTHGKRNSTSRGYGILRMFNGISWRVLAIGGFLATALYVGFFYFVFVLPFSSRWQAIFGEIPLPQGYDVCGIDVSHYQGRIKWDEVRNASIGNSPIRFVFIKATEGENLMDQNFNENFFLSRENDFIRGAYHFYVPGVSPEKQADFFLRQVHLVPGDLPPVLDVEVNGKLTARELQRDVKTWLNIVERKYGVKPIIYTGYKFKMKYLNTPEFAEYPYWIAHYYVRQLEYQGKWAFWQHTDCGKVKGIQGFVDYNIFNGDLQTLLQLTIQER